MSGHTFCMVLFWKNVDIFGKTAADMAGLGKYCTGGYGRIGVYRVHKGIPRGIT